VREESHHRGTEEAQRDTERKRRRRREREREREKELQRRGAEDSQRSQRKRRREEGKRDFVTLILSFFSAISAHPLRLCVEASLSPPLCVPLCLLCASVVRLLQLAVDE